MNNAANTDYTFVFLPFLSLPNANAHYVIVAYLLESFWPLG